MNSQKTLPTMIKRDWTMFVSYSRLRRALGVALALGCLWGLPSASYAGGPTLDETWTVTVNGQTVPVYPNGSFKVPNVQAPDNFGPGGPGTAPDFQADDWTRAVATRTVGGDTEYAFSVPFKIVQNESTRVENFTFTNEPPPLPVSITLTAIPAVVVSGETAQLTVTGTLPDGTTVDLTPVSAWTSYKVSNPAKATVDADGVVHAMEPGSFLVVAMNEGAVATRTMFVQPAAPTTIVNGHTRLANGDVLPGVTVDVQSLGLSTVTDVNGFFSIPGVPADLGLLTLDALLIDGSDTFVGTVVGVEPRADGITDAGIITMNRGPELLATSATRPAGATVRLGVVLNSDQVLQGMSFGLCHDPLFLDLGPLAPVVLGSDLLAADPDFVAISEGTDGVTCGIVMDFLSISLLAPSIGLSVINVDYVLNGPAGTTTTVDFCSEVLLPTGPFPISIALSDATGSTFIPATTAGQVTITAPPPP